VDRADAPFLAIRDALPTVRHAGMLFDMVVERAGAGAWVETANGGKRRTLHLRESPGSDFLVPWPLLLLSTEGRLGVVGPAFGPEGIAEEPPRRPGAAPRLRGLGPGEIEMRDGRQRVGLTYGDDGRWIETSVDTEDDLPDARAALERGGGNPVELLADFLARRDLARHGPGRLRMPVRQPGEARGLWEGGLRAIRTALFAGRVPDSARWCAADPFGGATLVWGATRDETLEAWSQEVERVRPRPPAAPEGKPPPASSVTAFPTPEGGFGLEMRLTGPRGDVREPDYTPAAIPASFLELEPPHAGSGPWGRGTRLLDRFGSTAHALVRDEPEGFTLVGGELADRIDLARLDRRLEVAALHEVPGLDEMRAKVAPGLSAHDTLTVTYQLLDDRTHRPVPARVVASKRSPGFDAGSLDGGELAWRVLRLRRLA